MANQSGYISVAVEETSEDKTENKIDFYRLTRVFSNACQNNLIKQVQDIHTDYPQLQSLTKWETLKTVEKTTLKNPETGNAFRNEVLNEIFAYACENCENDKELLFFAAVKFDLPKLREVIEKLREGTAAFSENINQTHYCDSVILFVLKYGNICDEKFQECMTILVNAGVDVNKFDVKGQTALDIVATLYNNNKNKNVLQTLKNVAALFLHKKIFKPDNSKTLDFLKKHMMLDFENYEFLSMDLKTQLFFHIRKNEIKKFLGSKKEIRKYANSDDGENTLLQIASNGKKPEMLDVVRFVLENGADPNLTTKYNTQTPLEIASCSHISIFEEILKHKKTEITKEQYSNLVKQGSKKTLDILVEFAKIETDWTDEETGDTPLHSAICLPNKNAIQALLKRNSSLVRKNKNQKCALDIIDPEDLKKYLDSCLKLDERVSYFSDINYKMRFYFNCLVEKYDSSNIKTTREIKVVSKIGQRPHLRHLLVHPLLDTFITMKWSKITSLFYVFLFFQTFIFFTQSVLLCRLPYSSRVEYGFCIFLTIFNIVLKVRIFLLFKLKHKKRPVFFVLSRAPLHGFLELLLIVTMVVCFFEDHFRAFAIVQMAFILLLSAGYHPKLSQWSVMLQQVFKSFTLLLIFFSLIIAAFSMGFHLLFPNKEFFDNISTSLFKTYIMTTGEFNLSNDTFSNTSNISEKMMSISSGYAGYVFFLIFALSMTLVITNFWIGVAVTDIESIRKHSEENAMRNVIVFMFLVGCIYNSLSFLRLQKCIPNPLLFLRISKGQYDRKHEKFCVDFFVNKENQFEIKGFPTKVDNECLEKIKAHYYKETEKVKQEAKQQEEEQKKQEKEKKKKQEEKERQTILKMLKEIKGNSKLKQASEID